MEQEKGLKFDEGKVRFELIPPKPLHEVAKVLTHGAKKYGPRNWMLVDNHLDRYTGATYRHINAWQQGEDIDESGCHHLAHAICSLMFLLEKELEKEV